MATLWFLFALLCVTTAAPADGGVETGVAVGTVEDVPVAPALIPNGEEDDEMLRQEEEVLKQEEGVVKEEEAAAGPSEEGVKEVGALSVFCPVGWFTHGSHCFLYVRTSMTWINAEDYCQKNYGANLASIKDPSDNQYLKELIKLVGQTNVWIGGFYWQSRWRWVDGNGLYYTDWYSSSSSTSAPCAYLHRSTYLHSSGWYKVSCSANLSFICARKPGC